MAIFKSKYNVIIESALLHNKDAHRFKIDIFSEILIKVMVKHFQDGYSHEAGWSYFIPSHSVWVTPYLESIERLVIGWPKFLHFSVFNKLCSSDRPLLFMNFHCKCVCNENQGSLFVLLN